jgi:hypothetical protein
MQLSKDQDKLIWRWTMNAQYSSSSCYEHPLSMGGFMRLVEVELEILGAT